jgi:histidinol phosphatase-like PHP family hydrolase
LVDYHVHLDNSSIDQVLPLSRERGVRFGIVEHAGGKENQYPVVLSDDAALQRYLAGLEGKPVYRGVQAEWSDWMSCFSRETAAQLDYVLTDAMTFPGRDGRRVKLWEANAAARVDMTDAQMFMDRFVEWHVEILSRQPIDLLANVSWLPAPLSDNPTAFWTGPRMDRVIAAAVKHEVALEISSSFKLPRPDFLRRAQAAGVRFAFGSNGRYPNMGRLEYSLAMARELGLRKADCFTPAPAGGRAVDRRWPR